MGRCLDKLHVALLAQAFIVDLGRALTVGATSDFCSSSDCLERLSGLQPASTPHSQPQHPDENAAQRGIRVPANSRRVGSPREIAKGRERQAHTSTSSSRGSACFSIICENSSTVMSPVSVSANSVSRRLMVDSPTRTTAITSVIVLRTATIRKHEWGLHYAARDRPVEFVSFCCDKQRCATDTFRSNCCQQKGQSHNRWIPEGRRPVCIQSRFMPWINRSAVLDTRFACTKGQGSLHNLVAKVRNSSWARTFGPNSNLEANRWM